MAVAATQKKEWVISPTDSRAETLSQSLKISPLLAQILINREVIDTQAAGMFLKPKLTDLISPDLVPGVTEASQRIKKAIQKKEKITIYGDYDVDGITGVAILWQLLTLLGANVDYYIPHRIDEGYGLNETAVEALVKSGTNLLITVDCGITATNAVAAANTLGLDVIITDHHQYGTELPQALAIVHPALDESYANQDSCGAMVAFKLGWAVANEFKSGTKMAPHLREFMLNATTLAAMGTIADIMDLKGENRILASFGLKSLPTCELHGIKALIDTANLTGQGLDSFHIGFRLAPMLNAAGRMGHARLAVELLTGASQTRSVQIAEYLKDQNEQRKKLEQKISKQACELILQRNLNHPDQKSIVLAGENWHNGVVGIVASRIVDRYFRPAIIINSSNGLAQGSARSIPGFDILQAIEACSHHLTHFGGHKAAAGITIETKKIDAFAVDFESYAKENLRHEDTVEKLQIDALVPLSDLRFESVKELGMLEPFGQGNPRPVFATNGVRLCAPPRKVGAKGDHLQLAITDNTASVRCVGFSMGKFEKKLLEKDFFNVAYEPQINHYNGSSTVQLVLSDIQFE